MKSLDEAVNSYWLHLAPMLARRWGTQKFYSLEQVTQAAQAAGLTTEFIAYAHAMFCSRSDFDAYYAPLPVVYDYEDMRRVIGSRYCSGATDFDTATIMMMLMSG